MKAAQIAEQTQDIPQLPAETAAIIQVIERAASNPAVDVDKMSRLLDMQERVLNRNAQGVFDSAMAEMQAEMPVITERGEIKVEGKLRSKYATFEDINEAVKPILQKHGFAISFRTKVEGNQVIITAILTHRAGHREETSLPLASDTSGSKNAVQAIGSSVAYGKRYTMCALLNITSRGEDDDGNKAGGPQAVDKDQIANLEALLTETKADRKAFFKWLSSMTKINIIELDDIPAVAYREAVAQLERKRAK